MHARGRRFAPLLFIPIGHLLPVVASAYLSLFTIGHSATLLAGVLGGIHANSRVVDANIGLSVVYKAFDNIGGFRRFLGFEPNTQAAVLIFGLFRGSGLATKPRSSHSPRSFLLSPLAGYLVAGCFMAS